MSDDKRPTPGQLNRLLSDVRNLPAEQVGPHLEDDEFVEYSMGSLGAADVARMDAHLESCEECSARITHLTDVSEAWTGPGGEKRLEAVSARVIHEVRAAWSSESWAARIQKVPLRFASQLSKTLVMTPSALHFGGDPQNGPALESGLVAIGEPTAFSCGALFTSNGRELPEAAEVYWGHEIWLVQIPCSIMALPPGASAIGLAIGFPDQEIEVVDMAPRPPFVSPDLVVDIAWNGSMRPGDRGTLRPDTIQDLAADSGVQLSTGDQFVGRLFSRAMPCPVESAVNGLREAVFVFAANAGGSEHELHGNVWLTVVADKHTSEITIRVQPWVTIHGLNDVPARLSGQETTMPVRTVDRFEGRR